MAANAPEFDTDPSPVPTGLIIGGSDQAQQQVTTGDSSAKPKKLKRKPIVVALVLIVALLLVGGGSAFAYFGYLVPNKPNNVMKQAVVNAVNPETLKSFGVVATITPKADSGDTPTTIAVTAGSNSTVSGADFKVEFSAIKLSGSVLVNTGDDTLYVKINELPSLLGLVGLQTGQLQSKISGKWLKITPDTARQAVDVKNEGIASDACLSELGKLVSSDTFKNQLATLYTANEFANAAKVGTDTVNNVRSAKYQITVNNTTANAFITATSTYLKDQLGKTNAKCASNDSNNAVSDSVSSLTNDTKVSSAYIWVGPGKQLQKAQITISTPDQDIKLELMLNVEQKVNLTVPTDAVNVNDLQKELQSLLTF